MSRTRQGIVGRTELERVGVAEGDTGEDCHGGANTTCACVRKLDSILAVSWHRSSLPPRNQLGVTQSFLNDFLETATSC